MVMLKYPAEVEQPAAFVPAAPAAELPPTLEEAPETQPDIRTLPLTLLKLPAFWVALSIPAT